MSRRSVLFGAVAVLLAAVASAIPPPEPLVAYLARADLVVVGTVGEWERTSWVWQTPEVYESQVSVETVLKGQLAEKSFTLHVEVFPETTGGNLVSTPGTGRTLLFLLKDKEGYFEPITPDPYAFQEPSQANLDSLKAPS